MTFLAICVDSNKIVEYFDYLLKCSPVTEEMKDEIEVVRGIYYTWLKTLLKDALDGCYSMNLYISIDAFMDDLERWEKTEDASLCPRNYVLVEIASINLFPDEAMSCYKEEVLGTEVALIGAGKDLKYAMVPSVQLEELLKKVLSLRERKKRLEERKKELEER